MKAVRVLVTGAGSGVGQGIVKALRASSMPVTIISADISPLQAALYRADEALLMPKVEAPGALEAISSLLAENNIEVVMIGSEFDLAFFSEYKDVIEQKTGALVVVSPLDTVLIADDKWRTVEFLKKNKLPHAEAYLPANLDAAVQKGREWGYPLILKTRKGTSNRHVHLIFQEESLVDTFHHIPLPMLQKAIDIPSDSLKTEYTCSVFKCRDDTLLGPFTARRTLRGGSSWIVEVKDFQELVPLLLTIGRLLPIMGPFNIQLMVGANGPIPFEFNARFSGTTAIRAHFGFNEPEMTLQNFLFGAKIEKPVIRSGIALRYMEEVFIEGKTAEELMVPLPKGVVRPWF